jgi:hypothetical protein
MTEQEIRTKALEAAVSLYQTYITNRPQYDKSDEGQIMQVDDFILDHASIYERYITTGST